MSHRLRLLGLALAAAAAAVAAHGAQPPKPAGPATEPFTAFPDLKPPPRAVGGEIDIDALFERLKAGAARPVPADAPPLVKVRSAQVNEGYAYLYKIIHTIAIGRWQPEDHEGALRMVADVYRVAMHLEPAPAGKIALGEERVRVMKLFEEFTKARVGAGTDPPQRVNMTVFYRLQAEAELLQLLDSHKKPGGEK